MKSINITEAIKTKTANNLLFCKYNNKKVFQIQHTASDKVWYVVNNLRVRIVTILDEKYQ